MNRVRRLQSESTNAPVGRLLRIGIVCLITWGSSASCRCLLADEPLRQWNDASGKFSVNARLVRQSETDAVLEKTDGQTLTVPIGRLSRSDRDYLSTRKAASVPTAAPSPGNAGMLASGFQAPVLPGRGKELFLIAREVAQPITPDPAPQPMTSVPFVRPLQKIDSYSDMSMPIVVSRNAFAVSIYRRSGRENTNGSGKVYLVEADNKSPQVVLELNQAFRFLDHHPASGRTLAVIGSAGSLNQGGDLVLMTGFAEGKPVALGRARVPVPADQHSVPEIVAAKLIGGDVAVVQVDENLYVWSLSSGKMLFGVRDVRANFSVTGSGRYLAIGTSGGAQVIDVAKAEVISTLDFPVQLVPEVAFSPDGSKLAMVQSTHCRIWDLTQAKVLSEATFETSTTKLHGWIGNDYVLTINGLIDAATSERVWTYRFPSVTQVLRLRESVVFTDEIPVASLVCLPLPHRKFAAPGESRLQQGKWVDSDGGAPPLETITGPPMAAVVAGAPSQPLRVQGFDAPASGLELLNADDSVRPLSLQGREVLFVHDELATPQTPDPGPSAARFMAYRTLIENYDRSSRVETAAPLVVDAEKPIHAASVFQRSKSTGAPFGRVYLAMPKDDGTATVSPPIIDVAAPFYLTDHHRPSGHTLAMLDRDLVVMQNLASGKPDVIARWHLPHWTRSSSPPNVREAAWVSEEHVVVLYEHNVYCWSLASGELRFKIESAVISRQAVSGTGRLLAVLSSRDCFLVDVAKGEPIGRIELNDMVTPECHFSPDGRHLAFVFGKQLAVWDLTTARMVAETTFPGTLGGFVGWVGDGYLLTEVGGLIELDTTAGNASQAWDYWVSTVHGTTMPGGLIATTRTGGVNLLGLPIPHRAGILGQVKAVIGNRTRIRDGQWSD